MFNNINKDISRNHRETVQKCGQKREERRKAHTYCNQCDCTILW